MATATSDERATVHGDLQFLPLHKRQRRASGLYVLISSAPQIVRRIEPKDALDGTPGDQLAEAAWLHPRAFRWCCDRIELLPTGDPWDAEAAEEAARALAPSLRDRFVVLIGARVRDAFGVSAKHQLYRWRVHRLAGTKFQLAVSNTPARALAAANLGGIASSFWRTIGRHFEGATNLHPGGTVGIA